MVDHRSYGTTARTTQEVPVETFPSEPLPVPSERAGASSPVMELLHDHLPLTLLLDLALGVRSDEVYGAEPADVSWVPHAVA